MARRTLEHPGSSEKSPVEARGLSAPPGARHPETASHTRRGPETYVIYRVRRPPRAFLAGALSVLLPGVGQLYAGRVRRGLVMLAVATGILVAVVLLWLQGPVFLLRLLVRPDFLLALLFAIGCVFAFHALCIVDAYRLARRERIAAGLGRGRIVGRIAAVVVLLGLTAVPYAVAAYYDFREYDLLSGVFAEAEPERPEPVGGDEQPEQPSYWKSRGRVNFLLLGGDAGYDRYGRRTDTMMVLSLNTRTGRSALFGLPRNLIDVPLPPSARTELELFPEILNALWQYAEGNQTLYPGAKSPGATALKETIGYLLGLRIDYYALVDLRGFAEVIDALGGVTVNVQARVYDPGVSSPFEGEPRIRVDLEPGRHRMDGRLALAYVRTRWATSDYDRMKRQRCVIAALVEEASVPKLLRGFPRIASTIKKYVQTDLPLRALPDLIELLPGLKRQGIVAVGFAPPRFADGWRDGYPVPDVALIRRTVGEALQAKPPIGQETGLDALRQSCA
jgi:LCP family protein required for cell wall assembly